MKSPDAAASCRLASHTKPPDKRGLALSTTKNHLHHIFDKLAACRHEDARPVEKSATLPDEELELLVIPAG